ncbi:MAG: hypothetical protein ACJ76G_04085 [Solirubrobacterales bacterium]
MVTGDSAARAPVLLPAGALRRYPLEGLLARVLAAVLDRRLADGVDPADGPLLVARAAQLARPRARRSAAAHWKRILDEVRLRPKPLTHAVSFRTQQVADAAPEILALVMRLRDELPVSPVGVAQARRLLVDARGPLFDRSAPRGDLGARISLILLELDRVAPISLQIE